MLVDVMGFVGWGQNLALVDEVDADLLKNLSFSEMTDASLSHDRDGNCLNDLLDQAGLRHAGDAAFGTNHRGNAFKGHDRSGASLFSDAGLLDVHDVHDDPAFQHFGETNLQAETGSWNTLIFILLWHFS